MYHIPFHSHLTVVSLWLTGALTAFFLTGCSSKAEKEPLLLGHIAPFSGSTKFVGEQEKQGIILAVEDCNQEDRRIAGQKVAVLHADSQGKPDILQAETDRLITVNKVTGLLAFTLPQDSERLARSAESSAIPLVLCNPVASSQKDKVLSVALSPAQQGQALARFVQSDDLKAKKIAVLIDNGRIAMADTALAFMKALSPEGPSREQWTYEGTNRFPELIENVVNFKPDVIVLASDAADVSALKAGFKKKDLNASIVFAGDETTMQPLLSNREAMEGIYWATSYVPGEESDDGKVFAKRYQERFSQAPAVNGVLAYEAAGLMFEALRRAKKTDPGAAREALAGIDSFPGVTGPLVIKNQVIRRNVFIAQSDGKESKVFKRYKPEE
jgi:branched-chain amino acid transport system substrate-binding protein